MSNLTIFKERGIDLSQFPERIEDIQITGGVIVSGVLDRSEPELTPFQKARLGKITGSQFHRVTYGRDDEGWSQSAWSYLYEIVFEWLTYQPATRFDGSRATEWGNEQEPVARSKYIEKTKQSVVANKFYVLKGFKLVGCTPDAVSKSKGVEFKSPYGAKNHIKALITKAVPAEHLDQVIGHRLCTNKKTIDFVSFDPRMIDEERQIVIIECKPPQIAVDELKERLKKFEALVIRHLEALGIDWEKGIHKIHAKKK